MFPFDNSSIYLSSSYYFVFHWFIDTSLISTEALKLLDLISKISFVVYAYDFVLGWVIGKKLLGVFSLIGTRLEALVNANMNIFRFGPFLMIPLLLISKICRLLNCRFRYVCFANSQLWRRIVGLGRVIMSINKVALTCTGGQQLQVMVSLCS